MHKLKENATSGRIARRKERKKGKK